MNYRKRGCVFGCEDITGINLHQFPNPDKKPELFANWMSIVGDKVKEPDPLRVYSNKRVCGRHFKPEDKTTGHRIAFNSIPTINLEGVPKSLTTITESEHNYSTRMGIYIEHASSTSKNKETHHSLQFFLGDTHDFSNYGGEYLYGIKCAEDNSEIISKPYAAAKIEEALPASLQEDEVSESGPFSWNTACEIVYSIDDDNDFEERKGDGYNKELLMYDDFTQPSDQYKDTNNKGLFHTYHNHDTSQQQKVAMQRSRVNSVAGDYCRQAERMLNDRQHEDFKCNECGNCVAGFRYLCVQCPDYDICSSCEAGGSHASHYMLRVPGPRPYEEIFSVLESVRRQLFNNDILLDPKDDRVKTEVKEEVEDVWDPLQYEIDHEGVFLSHLLSDQPSEMDQLQDSDKDTAKEFQLSPNVPKEIDMSNTKAESSFTSNKRKLDDSTAIAIKEIMSKNPKVVLTKLPLQKEKQVIANQLLQKERRKEIVKQPLFIEKN